MNRLRATLKFGLGTGGAITTLMGIVTDFLMPLGPYGFYLGLIGLFLIIISFALMLNKHTNELMKRLMAENWYLPSFVLLLVFSGSMFIFYNMGKNAPGEMGFLAANINEISEMQSQVLDKTIQIEKNTRRTAQSVEILTGIVKKETSDNPRKELANQGIAWDENSLIVAINNGEQDTVKLFIAAGMKLESRGWARVISSIKPAGLRHLRSYLEPLRFNSEQSLIMDSDAFYESGLYKVNAIRSAIEKYEVSEKIKLLEEHNNQVASNRQKYIDYAKAISRYIQPYLRVNKHSSTFCEQELNRLRKSGNEIKSISSQEDILSIKIDVKFVTSTLNNLDKCSEFSNFATKRPQEPQIDPTEEWIKKSVDEIFLSILPEQIKLDLVQYAKLIRPDVYELLSEVGFSTGNQVQIMMSNGRWLNLSV